MLVTAPGEEAFDGLVILSGVQLSRRKKVQVPVLLFSQSKKQATSGITGLPSGSKLYNGTIETDILAGMRKAGATFKSKHGKFRNAFVVYDIFSDRVGPKRTGSKFELGENEAILVTRSQNLDSVLGGLSARKRPIPT